MKKYRYLLLVLMAVFLTSAVFADTMKSSASEALLGDAGADDGSSSTTTAEGDESASETAADATDKKTEESSESNGMATLPNGTAYVGVYSFLNCRDGVWGSVLTTFDNNQEVNITGRDGDWYTIDSPREGYVHARYIFAEKDKRYYGNEVTEPGSSSSSSSSGGDVVLNVSGDSVQGKVVSAAQELVNKYSSSGSFPYDAATNNGSLGCAQVVTTALKAAGVLSSTSLACLETIDMLKNVGWQQVSAPPYQAGDVILWATYDRTGDGVKDSDTHIGIIMSSGNSVQAMSNSSSQKKPRLHDAEYQPVSRVLRKC